MYILEERLDEADLLRHLWDQDRRLAPSHSGPATLSSQRDSPPQLLGYYCNPESGWRTGM